jgi:hypothetical protein
MISPDEIIHRVDRLYLPFLRSWLVGDSFFPQSFPVGERPDDYITLRREVEQLMRHAKPDDGHGYRVEVHTVNTRQLGPQTIPERVILDGERDLLKLLRKEREFAAFTEDVVLLRRELPMLSEWLVNNPRLVIEQHGHWPDLISVCHYFMANPRPNLYTRELPIPVHTKFIEENEPILRRLLDFLLPANVVDQDQRQFPKRYGLRYDEPLVRFRFLDPGIRHSAPYTDLSVPLSQFTAYPLNIRRCLIVENQMTFLTLPPLADTFALFGGGFRVELFEVASWLRQCSIFYWGDLDVQGFQILCLLRSILPQTVSILMDAETLAAHHNYTVSGTPAQIDMLSYLTPDEHRLFVELMQGNIRLEQEHIAYPYSVSKLTQNLTG